MNLELRRRVGIVSLCAIATMGIGVLSAESASANSAGTAAALGKAVPLVAAGTGLSKDSFGSAANGHAWVFDWCDPTDCSSPTVIASDLSTNGDDVAIGSLTTSSNPRGEVIGVGKNNLGNLEVYVQVDNVVYHDYQTPGAGNGWSGFSPLGSLPGTSIVGDVAAGRNYLNNQEIYALGSNGIVYHNFATPGVGTGWNGWDPMDTVTGGPDANANVHVGHNSYGNQELYLVAASGQLFHDFATPGLGTGWSGWDPMDGLPAGLAFSSDVQVGINYAGNQELYAVGGDNQLYHNFATPGQGTGWSSFGSLGAPSAGINVNDGIELVAQDFSILDGQAVLVRDNSGNDNEIHQTPGVGSGWSQWAPVQ